MRAKKPTPRAMYSRSMTLPSSVNGGAMDYRDLLIKMQLRLLGKALRKHKVVEITAPESQKRFQIARLTNKDSFPVFTRTLVSHPTWKKKGLSQSPGCHLFGILMGRCPLLNGYSTSEW